MEKGKTQRIKNPQYRKFLDEGMIEPLTIDQIMQAANNIKGKRAKEGRVLLFILYYTGARPVEILDMRAKDVTRSGNFVALQVRGAKNGLPRKIFLKVQHPGVKEIWEYCSGLMPEVYVFFSYRGGYVRSHIKKNGDIVKYVETTARLRYYFPKWFQGITDITPYFLRHSRFSSLAEAGANDRELQQLKGAKTVASIQPYIHMSTVTAKSLAKKLK